jgi:uncharacterized protein YndB with AHSA1/START domain
MSSERGTVSVDDEEATVVFERLVAAPMDELWAGLTDGQRLGSWLAPGSIDPLIGGAARIDFEGEGGSVTGVVTEHDPPHRLAYTWLIAGEPESTVEWSLHAEVDATRLILIHRALPGSMAAGYGAGWHAYLDRLQAVAEGSEVPDWDRRYEDLLPGYRT